MPLFFILFYMTRYEYITQGIHIISLDGCVLQRWFDVGWKLASLGAHCKFGSGQYQI
jgi:hypothetical protein